MPGWRIPALLLSAAVLASAQRIIQTFAGTDWVFPGDGRPAVDAPLGPVDQVAVDAAGNVYVSDPRAHLVMKVDAAGILTVVAGNGIPGNSGDGGPATQASIRSPLALAFDGAGNLLIAAGGPIRRVTPAGIISTLTTALPATQGLAVDRTGAIYASDSGPRSRVLKLTPAGQVVVVAGTGQAGYSGDNGPANQAMLSDPRGLAFDAAGNLYIAEVEGGGRIRKLSPEGVITTFAGTGTGGALGDGGPAIRASIVPLALSFDAAGNLYLTDAGRIRRIAPDGIITTVAGAAPSGLPGAGDGGPALQAALNGPRGVATGPAGDFYVADSSNLRIRRVGADGIITTLAGNNTYRRSPDGAAATSAWLDNVQTIAVDRAGTLYYGENGSNRVRRIGPDGTIVTLAGNGVLGGSRPGFPATETPLGSPAGLAFDAEGTLHIGVAGDRVLKITPDGILANVVSGGGIRRVTGIAFDGTGNLYISDRDSHRIWRRTPEGTLSTLAGTGQEGFSGDSGPAIAATLRSPQGIVVDPGGNVLFVDAGNGRIRRITPEGTISTVADRANFAVAVDGAGTIYHTSGAEITRMLPDGTRSRFAGTGASGFSGDGGLATNALFRSPNGVAVDAAGNVYVSDSENGRIRVVVAPPPTFQVGASTANFSARAGAAAPPPANLNVTGSAVGLAFTVSATTTTGGSWLKTSLSAGAMPAVVDVTVDPAGLAPGAYRGTIAFTAPNASPPTRTVAVTFTVQPADVARLSLAPSSLAFALVRGGGAATRRVTALSPGAAIPFTAAASERWLNVAPASGSAAAAAPVSLIVTANPAGLDAGTYVGRITVTNSATSERVETPVTLTVTAVPQSILLSQTGLTFTAVQGGGVPPAQSFGVLNTGQGRMNWSVTALTLSGGSAWLRATPASGSSDAASQTVPSVDVAVAAVGLAAGLYYGQVQVTAAEAANSPQAVSVVLNVLPPGSNPGPLVRPTGLIFTAGVGTSPGSQSTTVSNLSAATTTFASNGLTLEGANWFVHIPTNAVVTPERPVKMVVQPEIGGLPAGVRRGVVTLLFQDGTVRTLNLLLVLSPGGTGRLVGQSGCAPSRLLPLFTTLGSEFSVPAGWPMAVEARVVDDCGNPLVAGSVVASFSNGDPPLALVSLRDGRWAGTWHVRDARPGQVIVTVSAESAVPPIRGTTQLTGLVQASEGPPVVGSGAVVNAASFSPEALVAPGSLVSIFGSRLAEGQGSATGLPLETQLAGTLVALGGRALPLLYASDGQVNALVPYDVAVNTRHQLLVRRGSNLSVPEAVIVAAAAPAVFTKNQTGKGQGVIVDVTGQFVEPGNAARSRDAVVIYCSGLGAVNPPVAAGTAAPVDPLARVASLVTVTIGGRSAQVLFAGLTPEFAGLYQVNVVVPDGVTPGNEVPVVLTVAGQSSPPVTMAVR